MTSMSPQEPSQTETREKVGIYVYTLPHYLQFPCDPATGRTLMKVGRSDSDVIVRFRSQTRITALPEEPLLLRIYKTDRGSAAAVEMQFHQLLKAADHSRSVTRCAGREWFLTSTRFLDQIARTLDLVIEIVNNGDDIWRLVRVGKVSGLRGPALPARILTTGSVLTFRLTSCKKPAVRASKKAWSGATGRRCGR